MSSILSHIQVQHFRRLANLDVELRPLTVIIGANSVGKTSLLDLLDLLAHSASGNLSIKLSELGGLNTNITYDQERVLIVDVARDSGDAAPHPLKYYLELEPSGTGYVVSNELLTGKRKEHRSPFEYIRSARGDIRYYDVARHKFTAPSWKHNALETSLAQVPKMFEDPEDFRRSLASIAYYHFLDVSERAPVRLPQQMRPAATPGKNGEDLISCLYYLRETQRNKFEDIEDHLRAAFPAFERLDFPPVAAGMLTMTWKESSFSIPIAVHQLSEGILRFLWLLAILATAEQTSLTLIDEPEVSLHPELLQLLASQLRHASSSGQIIVATHSERLIAFLEPSEVLVADMVEDGSANMRWADSFDIEAWLEDYRLDELWRLGRIGGRA